MNTKTHIILLGLLGMSTFMSYSLYTPIPDGFSDPWALRKLHIRFTATIAIGRWLDYLGIMELGDFTNSVLAGKPISVPGVDAVDFDVQHVPVRIRTTQGGKKSDKLPAFIFYHGGAYLLGDRYMHELMLSEMSKDLNAVVISVTYRLAPKHNWPAQFDDCVLVAKYFLENAANYGIDNSRIALGGDSAGAHLASSVNLKLNDDNFPVQPKSQVLIYPVCQFYDFSLPSHVQNTAGPILSRDLVLFSLSNLILGNNSITFALENNNHVTREFQEISRNRIIHDNIPTALRYHPYTFQRPVNDGNKAVWKQIESAMTPHLNILMSKQLSSQPRTFLFTAHYDPLRDDGYLYAKALRDAGVDVTHFNHPKGVHGMLRFFNSLPEGRDLYGRMLDFLRTSL